VPKLEDIPPGDNRNFTDRRTFAGVYVNDEWTPTPRLTFTLGARYDSTSESLHVFQQEIGDPNFDTVDDSRRDGQFSGGVSSLFPMIFENTGVGVRDVNGEPALTNAGSERFQGMEIQTSYLPPFAEGLSLTSGYAHHDARFIRFSFFTPDGTFRVVDGKRLELVP